MVNHEERLDSGKLFLFRTLYFTDGLGGSAWGRFGVIFYNQVKHMNEQQIGNLQGIRPIIGFVARLFWGWVADSIQSRKTIFCVCKVGATVCLMTLALPSTTFQAVAFSVMGMAMFPTVGVLDAHVMDFLGDQHRGLYGSIRLFATISWGLGSVFMGILTDKFGFVWNFGVFGSMMTVSLLFTIACLPSRSKTEQTRYERAHSKPSWAVLKRSLLKWQICIWFVEIAALGAAMSLVDSFLFVYLQNDLGASSALCGYTVGVTVMLEIPVFAHSQTLLTKLGHDGLLVVAMVAYSIRVFGYTLLSPETVHWVLLLEILHGITFATAWTATVDFSAQFAPKEWSTVVQSLTSAFWSCFGGGLGPIIGGLIYHKNGAVVMFRGAGSLILVLMAFRLFLWSTGIFGHAAFLLSNEKFEPVETEDETTSQSVEVVQLRAIEKNEESID